MRGARRGPRCDGPFTPARGRFAPRAHRPIGRPHENLAWHTSQAPRRRRPRRRRGRARTGRGVGRCTSAPKAPAPKTVNLQILSFNDYHGHLSPPPGNDGLLTTAAGTPPTTVPAGGVEYLTTHLKALREGHANTLTVAAGDLIGGSPFLSGLFKDEPSIETLDTLGLDVSGVGNHEFDEGVAGAAAHPVRRLPPDRGLLRRRRVHRARRSTTSPPT